MKMKNDPLVMDIPGPSEAAKGRPLKDLVEEAVGFEISKTGRG
jgi:vacuolar-type H+-ATPase subunit F/Vma7